MRIQAVVDDYQQAWDELRRQRRAVLWEQAAAQSGVPQYLGYPDDLKLLLMKAQNRKRPGQGYQVADTNRLSFHGRWYVCPGLLSRLKGREFEVYFDRRVWRHEAVHARKRRSTEIRANEQARQWDRQREEIHPAEVAERLADIEKKKLAPPKMKRAVPDADADRPVRILPMRPM